MIRLGYNTNGFGCHRIEDAIDILADIGYCSVALTLEPHFFHPPDRRGIGTCVERIAGGIARHGLAVTIETGGRYVLDARRKHHPTLVSGRPSDRQRRIDFLKASVELARALSAESVSLWSGAADDGAAEEECWTRLTAGLGDVLGVAEHERVRLAFEPEPGMFIDTMARFDQLQDRLGAPHLGLTLDVGHVFCTGDGSAAEHIRRHRDSLWNIHIEDMRRGVHEHLPFGEGEMEFTGVFQALREIRYRGPVHVELSRASHDAVQTAQRAFDDLKRMAGGG